MQTKLRLAFGQYCISQLLHGLGFAAVLSTAGLSPQLVVVALLGFNLGIELTQFALALPVMAMERWILPRLVTNESTPLAIKRAAGGLHGSSRRNLVR